MKIMDDEKRLLGIMVRDGWTEEMAVCALAARRAIGAIFAGEIQDPLAIEAMKALAKLSGEEKGIIKEILSGEPIMKDMKYD